MACAVCGGAVEVRPFYYQPDKDRPGVWYEAPLYFSKVGQSKVDFAGPVGRVDFCSARCATAFMRPRDNHPRLV